MYLPLAFNLLLVIQSVILLRRTKETLKFMMSKLILVDYQSTKQTEAVWRVDILKNTKNEHKQKK